MIAIDVASLMTFLIWAFLDTISYNLWHEYTSIGWLLTGFLELHLLRIFRIFPDVYVTYGNAKSQMAISF